MVPIPDPKLAATDLPAEPMADSTLDRTGAYHPASDTDPASSDTVAGLPTISGYAITGEIARGGMGRVLAGRELALDREVAIKVLLPGANAERFVTESKITAKLPHPNIPPVHALGTLADGSPYLAMKLIRGRTLAAELGDRPDVSAELTRFIQIFEQMAQAVGFAHSRGIIHRDLKPLNVMVGEFGEVQVMDWGLAKDLASLVPESGDTSFNEDNHLTLAGSIFGTAAYMPPEQARGEAVDARADVFALGATLMEILTGERPWGSGPSAVVIQRASRALLNGCHETLAQCPADQELVAVTRKCLSADATDRYPDGRAVAGAVAAYRAGVEQRLKQAETARAEAIVREAEQRKRRRVMQWAGGIIAGALLAGTGISLWQAGEAREAAKSEAVQKGIADEKALLAEQQEGIAKEKAIEATNQAARAEKEKENAQSQAKRAETIVGLTTGLFQTSDPTGLSGIGLLPPNQRSRGLTLSEILKSGSATISEKLKDDPLTRAALLDVLGDANRSVGNKELSKEYLEEALRLREANLPADHPDIYASRFHVANWHIEQGNPAVALAHYQSLLDWHTQRDTLDTLAGAELRLRYSIALISVGDPAGEALARQGLATREKIHGKDHRETTIARMALATALLDLGDMKDGLKLIAESFAILSRDPEAAKDPTIQAVNEYQRALITQSFAPSLAESGIRKSCDILQSAIGSDHIYLAVFKFNHAEMLRALGKTKEAEERYVECVQIVRQTVGMGHPRAITLVTGYGEYLFKSGRPQEAWQLFEEADRLVKERYPNEFRWRFRIACEHGRFAGKLKKTQEALRDTEIAFEFLRQLKRPMTDREENAMIGLADGIGNLPDIDDIRKTYRRFDEPGIPKLTEKYRRTNLQNYGCILVERNLYGEALPILRDILGPDERPIDQSDSGFGGYACWQLAKCYWHAGEFEKVDKFFRRASKLMARDPDTDNLKLQKEFLNFSLLHNRVADTPPLIEKYKQRKDLTALNRSWVTCVEALSAKPGQAFDLAEVERRFGTSTERDVAMYRGYAVIAAGGDVRREHKRLAEMIRNGQEVTTVVEVYSCCDLMMGNFEKALGNFKLYKLEPTIGFRHYKHRLLIAFCAERIQSTDETRKALQEASDAAERQLKTGDQMKDVAIGGYALNEGLLLRFWLRHIQLALEPKPRETIPPPRLLK